MSDLKMLGLGYVGLVIFGVAAAIFWLVLGFAALVAFVYIIAGISELLRRLTEPKEKDE